MLFYQRKVRIRETFLFPDDMRKTSSFLSTNRSYGMNLPAGEMQLTLRTTNKSELGGGGTDGILISLANSGVKRGPKFLIQFSLEVYALGH